MTADGRLITAAGEAYDSGREPHYWGGKRLMTADGGAFCVRFCVFYFYESDSFSVDDFQYPLCLVIGLTSIFEILLSPLHKCQIVMAVLFCHFYVQPE